MRYLLRLTSTHHTLRSFFTSHLKLFHEDLLVSTFSLGFAAFSIDLVSTPTSWGWIRHWNNWLVNKQVVL